MENLIIVHEDKCVGCNACVRVCHAPEANITRQLQDGRFVTTVDPVHCIACGECVRACMHGARDYLDDTAKAFETLSTKKCIVLAAPSIKTTFPNRWKGVLDYFRRRGALVYDVSFGADICTWAHLRAIQNGDVGKIVTQPCAAIVKYIETYQPTLIKNLSPVHSPIACAAIYIKKYLKRTEPIIVLSPCVAKKYEFMETGLVSYNVTFNKLREYLERNMIDISSDDPGDYTYDFAYMQGQMGAIYPRPGGLRDNLWLHDPDIQITTSEGVHKVYRELDAYAELSEDRKPEVFDVLSCEYGCNVGAGTGTNRSIFGIVDTMRGIEKEAKTRRKTTGGLFRGAEDKLFKQFDNELDLNHFYRSYRPIMPTLMPTMAQLEPVFESMGKHTNEERSYNCHACGYQSCRAMATAIYRGLNSPDNCIVHAKSVLLARHSAISAKNEALSEIRQNCIDLSDKLVNYLSEIESMMNDINALNGKTDDRAGSVRDLLQNVITYCNDSDQLDHNGLNTMSDILKQTLQSFSALNDNVLATSSDTDAIATRIADVRACVDEINTVLAQKI